jgi:hypothetical protein
MPSKRRSFEMQLPTRTSYFLSGSVFQSRIPRAVTVIGLDAFSTAKSNRNGVNCASVGGSTINGHITSCSGVSASMKLISTAVPSSDVFPRPPVLSSRNWEQSRSYHPARQLHCPFVVSHRPWSGPEHQGFPGHGISDGGKVVSNGTSVGSAVCFGGRVSTNSVGLAVGLEEGTTDGRNDGSFVGFKVGLILGNSVGLGDGSTEGSTEGAGVAGVEMDSILMGAALVGAGVVGAKVGKAVGSADGARDGSELLGVSVDGTPDGATDGTGLGGAVGACDGECDGTNVGVPVDNVPPHGLDPAKPHAVGAVEGSKEGLVVGGRVGANVGEAVGVGDGAGDGCKVDGCVVGIRVGGSVVGTDVGREVVGGRVGAADDGMTVGLCEWGTDDGCPVG